MDISTQTYEQLELEKILDYVSTYVRGAGGREKLTQVAHLSEIDALRDELLRVRDITLMQEEGEPMSISPYEDIEQDLYLLSKNGYVLEVASIHRLLAVLHNYEDYLRYFKSKARQKSYPHVYELGYVEDYSDNSLKKILRVFDEEGNVRPDASPELIKIHKRIAGTQREADKRFGELLLKHKKNNLLADTQESLRNGRRVLVLPVVREDRYMIGRCYEQLWALDLVNAKGLFSARIQGQVPELVDQPILSLKDVRHPLLLLQERAQCRWQVSHPQSGRLGAPHVIPRSVDTCQ